MQLISVCQTHTQRSHLLPLPNCKRKDHKRAILTLLEFTSPPIHGKEFFHAPHRRIPSSGGGGTCLVACKKAILKVGWYLSTMGANERSELTLLTCSGIQALSNEMVAGCACACIYLDTSLLWANTAESEIACTLRRTLDGHELCTEGAWADQKHRGVTGLHCAASIPKRGLLICTLKSKKSKDPPTE